MQTKTDTNAKQPKTHEAIRRVPSDPPVENVGKVEETFLSYSLPLSFFLNCSEKI